jgi:hypothetical protein
MQSAGIYTVQYMYAGGPLKNHYLSAFPSGTYLYSASRRPCCWPIYTRICSIVVVYYSLKKKTVEVGQLLLELRFCINKYGSNGTSG